ncbi:MAG: hypothetical protein H6667_14500 [Ardenticatenaceae bacterium]|nr:hypothetical protein [Ardenticatenaceae bacterium]MCB9445551.1 hypothetical protein [Ardenticatenaceae bacterium]
MSQKAIRFGIRDDNDNRAATWKLWTESGRGKSELYLACRSLGGSIKVSFHQSGNWHYAYSKKTYQEQVMGTLTKLDDRFIEKWEKPPEIAEGITLAFRIVTPYSAITSSAKTGNYKKVIWLPNAPKPYATEVDIFLTKPDVQVTGWPGKRSMGTSLIGSFPLDCGDMAWAVYWIVDMPDLSRVAEGVGRFYKGKSVEDLKSDSLRAIVFGKEPDGSRVIYDCPVQERTKNK